MPAWGAVKDGPVGRRSKPAKVLAHLRVSEAENGGHVVEHHFTSYEHEPESHVFGKGQGAEMLAHVGKHMGVESAEEKHDEEIAEGSDKKEIEA
jgi:hypothetical protein